MEYMIRKTINDLEEFTKSFYSKSHKEYQVLKKVIAYNEFLEEAHSKPFKSLKTGIVHDYLEPEVFDILKKKYPTASSYELLEKSEGVVL
jgi:hypothetical protein